MASQAGRGMQILCIIRVSCSFVHRAFVRSSSAAVGPQLSPAIGEKSIPNRDRISPEASQNHSKIDPWRPRGTREAPRGSTEGPQGAPRLLQATPRATQGTPRGGPSRPKTPKGWPKGARRLPKCSRITPRTFPRPLRETTSHEKRYESCFWLDF